MINLLALMLSGVLTAGAVVATNLGPAQDVRQKERDESSEQRKATELLRRASRVEIEFVGNRFFLSPVLLEQMRLTRNPEQSDHPAHLTTDYYERLLDDIERVRFFLGMHGFITAKVGSRKVEDLGDRVKVTMQIEEGTRYRIGSVNVKGAKLLTPERIIEISGLRAGDIINAGIIQENVYKGIKDVYADQGYIQTDANFIPDFKQIYPGAAEGIVDITLEIEEGNVFFIRSIKFSGLVKTDEQSLRNLLSLREGDLFTRRILNETLKRLNQLGLFKEIREKDVITRTKDQDAQVDLTIQVEEINRQ